jgi:protein TonB
VARSPERPPKLLTPADGDVPEDFTSGDFVSGNGVAGGVVGGVLGGVAGGVVGGVPGGVVGGVGVPAGPPAPATPAKVHGPVTCAFPPESDDDKVDAARVVLRLTVEANGKASSVKVLADPGHGFGRAARGCALGFKYDPAKDGNGAPMKSDTTLVIRFQR